MKKYDMSFAAYLIIVIAIIGAIGTVIYYVNNVGEKEDKAVYRLPFDSGIETETEAVADTEIVFEPVIETETEVETKTAIPDTNEVAPKMNDETKPYSDDDLLYLAKIVQNEAGSDYCTDEHQRYVASVVLNRVASPRFPGDTILEIALCGYGDGYPIQYMYSLDPNEGEAVFWQIEPSERAIENARYVLENGVLDESVVWQAEFIQGEIVAEFAYPEIYDTVTYICR